MINPTRFESVEDFIKKHIRFRQHWNKKHISTQDAIWQELAEDTFLDGCNYAKGSRFKVFETPNFGWVVFGPDTRTADGNAPGKRIIRW